MRLYLEHFWAQMTKGETQVKSKVWEVMMSPQGDTSSGTRLVRVRQSQTEGANCKPVHHKEFLTLETGQWSLVITRFLNSETHH